MARPDRHREALLASMSTQLRRRGYAGAAIGDVLLGADATNGSLYHHFPGGKQDLALGAIAFSADRLVHGLRDALDAQPTVARGLAAWIDTMIAALEQHPCDACPIAPVALESPAISEPVRDAAAAGLERAGAEIEAALAAEGHTAAADRARLALSAIEGALLLDRTSGSTIHLRTVRANVASLVG
jgi:TetR/AcrR family transcriptional repressor of lmrAB and yxaGH operons